MDEKELEEYKEKEWQTKIYSFTEKFFKLESDAFRTFIKYLTLKLLREDIIDFDVYSSYQKVIITVYYRERKVIITDELDEIYEIVSHGDNSKEVKRLKDRITMEKQTWLPK